jgi:hypothetical protein
MDTNTAQQIASKVTAAIKGQGRTKASVAEAAGIPWTTFSRKCNGDAEFKVSELIRIAAELGVAASTLMPDFLVKAVAA